MSNHANSVVVGIMQRNFPLHTATIEALNTLSLKTIVIDASPEPIVKSSNNICVIRHVDCEGFFPIALLRPLFGAFLETPADKLFLIEGDMVLTEKNIKAAARCNDNTKVLYVESDPSSPHAYMRREGLSGVLLRSEIQRIHNWFLTKPATLFRKYPGYCDTFLWFAVSSETTGYSVSTSGPAWIPVLHITHDDSTRVTKAQRRTMKVYRARLAEVINMALECNKWQNMPTSTSNLSL